MRPLTDTTGGRPGVVRNCTSVALATLGIATGAAIYAATSVILEVLVMVPVEHDPPWKALGAALLLALCGLTSWALAKRPIVAVACSVTLLAVGVSAFLSPEPTGTLDGSFDTLDLFQSAGRTLIAPVMGVAVLGTLVGRNTRR